MSTLIKKFKLIFSCKDYSEACCKSRDQKLGLVERFRFSVHHVLCFTCRRFSKQLDILDSACRNLYSKNEFDGMKNSKKLSDSAKLKISSALAEEKNKTSS